ncbi:MAG: hypothetical protein ABUK01_15520 [Leptospirales bacterium]
MVRESYKVQPGLYRLFVGILIIVLFLVIITLLSAIKNSFNLGNDSFSVFLFTFVTISMFIFLRKFPREIKLVENVLYIHYYFRKDVEKSCDSITKILAGGKGAPFAEITIHFNDGLSIKLLESSENFIPFLLALMKQVEQCETANFEKLHKRTYIEPNDIALLMKEVKRIQEP